MGANLRILNVLQSSLPGVTNQSEDRTAMVYKPAGIANMLFGDYPYYSLLISI